MAGGRSGRERGAAGAAEGARRGRRRSLGSGLFMAAVLGAAALCVGGIAGAVVISHTAAGRGLALEWFLDRLRPAIDGSLTVGSIAPGGLLGGATLHDVRISDREGHTVLAVDSIRARYSLAQFLGGPPGLDDLELWSPVVDLAPADGRRLRGDSILLWSRVGPGAADGGAPEAADAVADPAGDARPSESAVGGDDAGFAIAGARIHGGTVVVRDHEGAVTRIGGIEARLGRLEFGPEPSLLMGVEALDLSYPLGIGALELRGVRGTVRSEEAAVVMDIERFELPRSVGRGGMRILLDAEGPPAVFDLEMERLALTDLSWIDERFDRGEARGRVRISTDPSGGRIEFAEGRAELGSARLGFSGAFDLGDPVRFDGLTLAPEGVPTAELDRWLPEPLPVSGTLTGEVRIDGGPNGLSAAGELALAGEGDGATVARLSGRGTRVGPGEVADVALDVAELDYGLLSIPFPQVPWTGSGRMTVRLDGDLRTGMAVEIDAHQSAPAGEASFVAVQGTVYGDTAVSVVELQTRMAPLSLTTVRGMYPDFPLEGAVEGTASLSGRLQELTFAANLETAAGPLEAEGQVNAADPAAGYQVEASVRDFRLSEFVGGLPEPLVLTATATLNGRGLDLESLRGGLVLEVDSARVGLLAVGSADLEAWVDDDGLMRIESVHAEAGGVEVRGEGALGTHSPAGDGVDLTVSSPSIRPLRDLFMGENLVAWDELLPLEQSNMIEFEGVDPDTFPRARDIRFGGRAQGRVRVEGALRDLLANAAVTFEGMEYGQFLARSLEADLTVTGMGLGAPGPVVVAGAIAGESVLFHDREYRSALLEGSFAPREGGRLRTLIARSGTESYDLQGVVGLRERGGRIDLDRFTVVRDDRRWNLRGPARFEWDRDAVVVRDFGLIRPGTEGLRLHADGRLARAEGESDFELQVADLDLGVVGSLLQLDASPTGVLSGDLRARGSGGDPVWDGGFEASEVELGTLSFDRVAMAGSYSGLELDADVEAWSGGVRNLLATGTLPLDLRLVSVADRIPDEPLDLRVETDSFPAAMILGGLDGLEGIEGTVTGDVTLRGRPSALQPDGSLQLRGGEATLAAFGTRMTETVIDLDLDPSGVVAVAGSAVSGGTLEVRGTVDLAGVQDDVGLELAFWPREFQVVDRPDLEAAVTGDSLVLTNTFNYPLILGAVQVVDGTVFIEEFQRTSEIVDLNDPVLFSAATVQFGPGGEASGDEPVGDRVPFLQNLRLDVDLALGRGNWLQSRNMSVETSGDLSLTYDRAGNQLIISGDADVVRGTYSLGPRTLHMTEGVFRFPGTPGFDPGLSVTAVTRLAICDGEPQEITTNISGTLLRPYLGIQSDAARATSEAELYGQLLLGRCSSTLVGAGGAASVLGGRDLLLGQFGNVLFHEFTEGLDLDYLSVSQADHGLATAALGASSVQVEVGRYLRDDVFLMGVYRRGFCADPTVPVSTGGMRVEVALPRDVTMETFLEGRCTREQYRGLDDISLQLARIWGFSFFREWGY